MRALVLVVTWTRATLGQRICAQRIVVFLCAKTEKPSLRLDWCRTDLVILCVNTKRLAPRAPVYLVLLTLELLSYPAGYS